MLFTHENDFNDVIAQASAEYGVSPAIIKGFIAAESNFVTRAYRAEPKIQDASRGLMQLLGSTARALGYTGTLGDDSARTGGLYDPGVNVHYGTKYIADLIRTAQAHGYGLDSVISAYNAGWSTVRPGDGKRVTNDPGAAFVNQQYVDQVTYYIDHYAAEASGSLPANTAPPSSTASDEGDSGEGSKIIALIVAIGLLATMWLSRHFHGA